MSNEGPIPDSGYNFSPQGSVWSAYSIPGTTTALFSIPHLYIGRVDYAILSLNWDPADLNVWADLMYGEVGNMAPILSVSNGNATIGVVPILQTRFIAQTSTPFVCGGGGFEIVSGSSLATRSSISALIAWSTAPM
jgi:hypothetical protein